MVTMEPSARRRARGGAEPFPSLQSGQRPSSSPAARRRSRFYPYKGADVGLRRVLDVDLPRVGVERVVGLRRGAAAIGVDAAGGLLVHRAVALDLAALVYLTNSVR